MKTFLALVKARNIEFYRDKGSLMWAFIFPLMIIVGCALAFSKPNLSLFKIGYIGDNSELTQHHFEQSIEYIAYQEIEPALKRVKHHQIDLLINHQQNNYWINEESNKSTLLKHLLASPLEDYQSNTLNGKAVRYVDWVIPGVLAMNLMFGSLFGVGYVIVRYRQNGVLKRFKATPISATSFISAQLFSRLLIVSSVNIIIFIGCYYTLKLLVIGSALNLFLILILGGMAMISLGLLIASRTANEELAGGLLNALTWPMLFLSEIWFTLDNSPEWMQQLSQLLPLTHIVQSARQVMLDGATLGDISVHLIALAIFSVLCILLSAKLFVWHK